jgi:hypothetical protein
MGEDCLMGRGGLEPPTPRLSSVCSNQLSYQPSRQLQIVGCKSSAAGKRAQTSLAFWRLRTDN